MYIQGREAERKLSVGQRGLRRLQIGRGDSGRGTMLILQYILVQNLRKITTITTAKAKKP